MERQPNPDDPAYRDQSTRRRLEEKKSKTSGQQLEEKGGYLDRGELDQEGKPLLSKEIDVESLTNLQKQKEDAKKWKKFDDAVAGAKSKEDLIEAGKIRKDIEERLGNNWVSLSTLALETFIGIGADVTTPALLATPLAPLYYPLNYSIGYGANILGQWLRGEEIKQGRAYAAGAFQTIPLGTAAKGVKGIARATVKGGVGSIVGEQVAVGIDENRVLTPQEVGYAGAFGGAFGGISKSALDNVDITGLRNTLNRLSKKRQVIVNLDGTLSIADDSIDGSKPLMSKGSGGGSGGKITDLNADKLSVDELKNQLDDNISFELGYNPSKISEKKYTAKLKAADGTVMPSEIATPFVRHGEAYLKANPTKTLEEFPHLWWKGEAWVLKGRNRYKTVNGKKQFVRKEVQIERWTDRKARGKLGRDARSLRVKEQSTGVKKGTFAYEKVKQLRERNIKREAAGLPPLRLRDSDLDHINALRSVDYYAKGMPEDFKKLIYQDLGKEGLFTGDHASNLKLREREVHRALWPELKRRLDLLGHKHTGFKTPEARYNYYKEINPKTGVTRLEEYAETVYAVEELGDDMMEQLLNTAKNKNIKSPSDPVKEALIKILGSEEDYTVFMNRLEDFPENMRKDFIIEEIKYHE